MNDLLIKVVLDIVFVSSSLLLLTRYVVLPWRVRRYATTYPQLLRYVEESGALVQMIMLNWRPGIERGVAQGRTLIYAPNSPLTLVFYAVIGVLCLAFPVNLWIVTVQDVLTNGASGDLLYNLLFLVIVPWLLLQAFSVGLALRGVDNPA